MKPADQLILTGADLTRAANDPRTETGARTRALDAIARFDHGETLLGGAVERDHLLRTYARRLKRRSEIVPFPLGTEELVGRLTKDQSADPVVVVARERQDDLAYFFCASDMSWLIGCIISSGLADADT